MDKKSRSEEVYKIEFFALFGFWNVLGMIGLILIFVGFEFFPGSGLLFETVKIKTKGFSVLASGEARPDFRHFSFPFRSFQLCFYR
jgi:hypothetical protein